MSDEISSLSGHLDDMEPVVKPASRIIDVGFFILNLYRHCEEHSDEAIWGGV